MSWWRDILRALGLTNDARVHISAPKIDIVITGDPDQVRHLLGVVKHELERNAVRRELGAGGRRKSMGSNQVVRPTELDEMDSPYVLPEATVRPVDESTGELVPTPVEDETIEEPKLRIPVIPAARAEVRVTALGEDLVTRPEVRSLNYDQHPDELPDLQVTVETDPTPPLEMEGTRIASRTGGRESSLSAVMADAFATDGGRTLLPENASNDPGTDPEVEEHDSDH